MTDQKRELTEQRDEARARAKKFRDMEKAEPYSPFLARWRDKAERYAASAEQRQAEIAALGKGE